jgi:hypothetical protein
MPAQIIHELLWYFNYYIAIRQEGISGGQKHLRKCRPPPNQECQGVPREEAANKKGRLQWIWGHVPSRKLETIGVRSYQ